MITLLHDLSNSKLKYVAYQYQMLQHGSMKFSMFDWQSVTKSCSSFFKSLTVKRRTYKRQTSKQVLRRLNVNVIGKYSKYTKSLRYYRSTPKSNQLFLVWVKNYENLSISFWVILLGDRTRGYRNQCNLLSGGNIQSSHSFSQQNARTFTGPRIVFQEYSVTLGKTVMLLSMECQ